MVWAVICLCFSMEAQTRDTHPAMENLSLGVTMEYFQRQFDDMPGQSDVEFINILLFGHYQFDERFGAYLGLGLSNTNIDGFFQHDFPSGQSHSGADFSDSNNICFRAGGTMMLYHDEIWDYRFTGFLELSGTSASDSTDLYLDEDVNHISANIDFWDLRTGVNGEYFGFSKYNVLLRGTLAFSYMTLDASGTEEYREPESGADMRYSFSMDEAAKDKFILSLGALYDVIRNLSVTVDAGILGDRGIRFGMIYTF